MEAGEDGEKRTSQNQGKSCKGTLYYSSVLKSKGRNPRCIGLSRTLQQVPSYIVGDSEVEASKEGQNLTDFRYACLGYSVYLDNKDASADGQKPRSELPVCVGLELLVDKRVPAADHSPVDAQSREEDQGFPQPRPHKTPHPVGEEFLSRYTRNASLVASGVARNLIKVGNYIKNSVDDILYPYRRRPNFGKSPADGERRRNAFEELKLKWQHPGFVFDFNNLEQIPSANRLYSSLSSSLRYSGRYITTKQISHPVNSNGKRSFLADTLALVRRLEAQGVPSKQAEAIAAATTEVLNDGLENVAQSFTAKAEMQKVWVCLIVIKLSLFIYYVIQAHYSISISPPTNNYINAERRESLLPALSRSCSSAYHFYYEGIYRYYQGSKLVMILILHAILI
ncbi:hypothetical protein Nepgr_008360 [Nepenthes gracilis]|uniref:DUF8204 domain-containing protein n=1 Tax=Nepenthes gracilis TaxID=150966 RepID=A0AAD3S8W5_NEPGR|nr:hypothetical protein Nepgr_008360 [Nepenthes gracilis]